ncbi:MAG: 4Fe-4S binding protein [Deltaproteobacteria bacterium]|nr:4Fe-4S binding protein [Deltaproteobacteria bacterium]
MEEKILLIDLDRCIRCYACEVACKQENRLPAGPRWASVVTVGPRIMEGELHQDFVFVTCFQCNEPLCLAACNTGAISKRGDGVVVIDETACQGCGLCVLACPYGAVHLRPGEKKAWKCDQCTERVNDGLGPSCVQHCAGGSLQFVTPAELILITAGRHNARLGKVCYVSTKWRLSS